MGGLVLKLAPNERILLNGLMIENGPKKARMTLHSDGAHVLRLRDALHPDQVNGPVSVAYHVAQLAVAGQADQEEALRDLLPRLDDLSQTFENTWAHEIIGKARQALEDCNFYKAMRELAPLLPLERDLLGEMKP